MNDVYCGPAPVPETLAQFWNPDVPALLLCAGLIAAFVILRPSNHRIALAGSVLLLAVLFLSPLCALTAALFSARAVHHIVLVAIVAPLLALVFPAFSSSRHALSIGWIAGLHAVVFWFWHAPTVYAVAITHPVAYWAMQLTLLGSAFWLWRGVFDMRENAGGVIFALLGTAVQMGFLGALLTFASTPLYDAHLLTTIPFGLTPEQDQQLAGLIMWVPAALPYLAAMLWRAWPLLGPSAKGAP